MVDLNEEAIQMLRECARTGCTVTSMYNQVKERIGSDASSVVRVVMYFQAAFGLSLAEAKPVGSLARAEYAIEEQLLDEFVMPYIDDRRSEWDNR